MRGLWNENFVIKKYTPYITIFVLSFLSILFYNRFPLARDFEWDTFWVDTQTFGRFETLKKSLLSFTFPFISLDYDFGYRYYADPGFQVSSMFPIHWLIAFFSGKFVWVTRIFFMNMLAGVGAYKVSKTITKNIPYSVFVSSMYILCPAIWTLRYGTGMDSSVYFLPFFSYVILKISQSNNKKYIFYYWIISFLSCGLIVSVANAINVFLFISSFSFIYTLFIRKSIKRSAFFSIKICFVYFSAGAFYFIPLALFAFECMEYKSLLCSKFGWCSGKFVTWESYLESIKIFLKGTLKFKNHSPYFYYYFSPLFLLGNILVIMKKKLNDNWAFIFSILSCAVFMIAFPFCILDTFINKSFTFRSHFIFVNYLLIISGLLTIFIFLNNIKNKKIPLFLCFAYVLLLSFNLYNRNKMLLFEQCLIISLMFFIFFMKEKVNVYIQSALIILSFSLCFFLQKTILPNPSAVLKNDYDNIQKTIQPELEKYSKKQRLFLTSKSWGGRGMNWHLIAPSEMSNIFGEKPIFSWNYGSHPYIFVLRSSFDDNNVRLSANMGPSSDVLYKGFSKQNTDKLKILGIRYILSVYDPIVGNNELRLIKNFFYKSSTHLDSKIPFVKEDIDSFDGLSGNIYLYELDNSQETAFCSQTFKIMDRHEIINALIKHSNIDEKQVLLDEPFSLDRPAKKAEVLSLEERDSSIYLETNSVDGESILVLTYLYYPFWKCKVDGKFSKVYRSYGGFMAVKIPEGIHKIEFFYVPSDFYVGLFITFLSILYLIYINIIHQINKRKISD